MHPRVHKSMRGTAGPITGIPKLCAALGLTEAFLNAALSADSAQRYEPALVSAAKSDGTPRAVFKPSLEIRRIQTRIVKRIFKANGAIRWHSFLYGSMPNQKRKDGFDEKKDYVSCAAVHCGAKSILKIDIKDFFGNIHSDSIIPIWENIFGYSNEVAVVLSDLCLKDDSLPQGGITSSYLAMLSLYDVEPKVVTILERKGLKYTRYVDDITVSAMVCDYDFDLALSLLSGMLISKALPINEKKLKRASIGTEALTVHGLRVSFPTPRLPADEVGRIRAMVQTVERMAATDGFRHTVSYRRSFNKCMGRVNKLSRVQHNQHSKLLDRLRRIKPTPSRNDIRRAVEGIRKLKKENSVRSASFGYKKRYFALIERINLIGTKHKKLAVILRGSLNGYDPNFKE